jgi:hypothetical protein
VFKVTNDIKTIGIKFEQRADTKKLELLIVKASEILGNYKHTGEVARKLFIWALI